MSTVNWKTVREQKYGKLGVNYENQNKKCNKDLFLEMVNKF